MPIERSVSFCKNPRDADFAPSANCHVKQLSATCIHLYVGLQWIKQRKTYAYRMFGELLQKSARRGFSPLAYLLR